MEYFYTGQLYEVFAQGKVNGKEWNNIIHDAKEHFCSCNVFDIKILDKQFRRYINQKFELYQSMSEQLFHTPEFFYNNPVRVKWNNAEGKNYFNIIDGNNRVAFLLAKGIYDIPCRMSKEDYNKWEKSLNSVITNPSKVSLYYREAFFRICRWLREKKIRIKDKRILCLESNGDYMKNHFVRMGGRKVLSYLDSELDDFDILIQDVGVQWDNNKINAKCKIYEAEYENKKANWDIICQKVKGNKLYAWYGLYKEKY